MTISSFLLISALIPFIFVSADYNASYTGLRYTFPKETFMNYWQDGFIKAIESSKSSQWPKIESHIGKAPFSVGFITENFRCAQAVYDPAKMTDKKTIYEINKILMHQKGTGLQYTFDFGWTVTIFEIPFFTGTAQLQLESAEFDSEIITQLELLSANIKPKWTIKTLNIKGVSLFAGAINKWIDYVDKAPLLNLIATSLSANLGASIEEKFLPILYMQNPIHDEHKLDMVLANAFWDVREASADALTFGFASIAIVDKRPYEKMMWRYINSSNLIEANYSQICLTSDVLVSMQEIIGKARDMIRVIKPEELQMSGTLRELAYFMPNLDTMYDIESKINIGCRPYGDYDMVMINDGVPVKEGEFRVQMALTCSFISDLDSKEIYASEFFIRGTVKKSVTDGGDKVVFAGILSNAKLYSYQTMTNIAAIEDNNAVLALNTKLAKLYEDFVFVPSGIKVLKPRATEQIMSIEHRGVDETCVLLK